jgi:glucuronate isomerase
MVAEHRMDLNEAEDLIVDLTYNLPKKAYKLDQRPDWARPTSVLPAAAE